MRTCLVAILLCVSVGCGDTPADDSDAGAFDSGGVDAGVERTDVGTLDASGVDVPSFDSSFDAPDVGAVDAGIDGGCLGDECVEVVDFALRSPATGSIEARVQLSSNAPCEVSYRASGETVWLARSPAEDSSDYGAGVPHVQLIQGLAPGEYEVRARDHVGGAYTTETLRIMVDGMAAGCGADATSWMLPSNVAYGSWTRANWSELLPGVARRYGDSDLNVRTLELDGLSAQIHRVIPTPPGSNGSSRVSAAWNLAPRGRYRLTQSIRLPETFAAGVDAQSGKLGWGLGGGTVPSGGEPDPAGFLVRVTFRGDRSQPDTRSVVTPAIYIYSADQAGRYGDELPIVVGGAEVEFVRGEWMEISFEVVANSRAGEADGELRVWVDGVLGLELRNKMWFGAGTPQVDRLTLSTFHGGASSRWAPSATNEIAFSSLCLN